MTVQENKPVRVNFPRRLPSWQLPAHRVDFGPGFKPSMAVLPDGSLVMVAMFGSGSVEAGDFREWTGI